jgi:hypothetical protein
VATNSICQGEQASTLWPSIFALGLKIHIAYQSFVWANNARDKAAVHVVVVGLSSKSKNKYLFQDISSVLHGKKVSNISPYLIEGPDIVVGSLNRPLNIQSPKMVKGNQATDGGYLFLDSSEKEQFLLKEPEAKNWIRPVLGAEEFLNGKERWCLWLVDATSEELADMPAVMMRLDAIRDRRLAAGHPAALKMADKPHIFMQVSQPRTGEYILVPSVSSERRTYVPMGFFDANVISTNLNYIIPNGSLYEFGILSSLLHNDWMRLVAGRLESRYRYSATIVYNTFPWPDSTPEQRNHIEALAQEILLVRADYPDKTLAQLYDPDLMPEQLKQAHHNLDLAVDALYQTKPFADASERLSCLLARYEKLVAAEQESEKQKPVKKSKKAELQSKD